MGGFLTALLAVALNTAPAPRPVDVWVDPTRGDDHRSGVSRGEAVRTVREAWSRVPAQLGARGYRLLLVRGSYPAGSVPSYWEKRHGTARAPIVVLAIDGPGSAHLPGMNVFDVSYLSLVGLRLAAGGGDVLHCERCDHLTIRRAQIVGRPPDTQAVQEAVKVNQSSHVEIDGSDISGAWDNAIDFVAVQHGRIFDNRIHAAGDWCMYLKGGSADFRVDANELFDCGTGGFTAGQGTGFEFMVAPWLQYEAYGIAFVNNVVHDTDGAGMGVNGAYDILLAYNTLYRVGARSHVLEVAFGLRGCDGDRVRCRANLAAGGWGTAGTGHEEPIPDRHVYVYDNLVYNPPGYRSRWQQLAVYGPRRPSSGTNVPSPARTDDDLRIRGNLIWNGPPSQPLGIEGGDQGCRPANPSCNAAQLRRDNAINTVEPRLTDPAHGDFRPVGAGSVKTFSPPAFAWGDAPARVPRAAPSLSVARDREGRLRSPDSPPGAYASRR